jgi:hypothetical protein
VAPDGLYGGLVSLRGLNGDIGCLDRTELMAHIRGETFSTAVLGCPLQLVFPPRLGHNSHTRRSLGACSRSGARKNC